MLDEVVLIAPMQVHRLCRNKQYIRLHMTNKKANPLMSFSLGSSIMKNHDLIAKNAPKVTYPYQLIIGEKDVIVDN